ncbi:hypothetical protein [Streptomyces sp. NPDC127112]|uniref:hypothetical protein n=1 Tax=Streptomyces sp. NPDC127112 TaxID=3345364 RepID=UPI00363910B6
MCSVSRCAEVRPELGDLADWFSTALTKAGYPSINAFITSHRNHRGSPLPDKNALYAIKNALELPSLETVRHLAEALGSPPETAASTWLRASRALAGKELGASLLLVGAGSEA